ncbi:MAG: helix-turn-helix domain-containing protein [Bacillota bacterium]|nr:helix-turn-helix domain-containing protein [Bacillota bacterium]
MADFTNQLLINSIYHLLNFEKYTNFQMAAKEAAIANKFQIVLFSTDFNPIFSVETRHKATIQDAIRKGIEIDIQHSSENVKVLCEGVTTYWGPIKLQDQKYYLMLVDNEECYNHDDIIKLAEIIELAMGMWNYTPQRDINAEFIRALRRGNAQLASNLIQEMGIEEKDFVGVFLCPGADKEPALKVLSAQEERFGSHALRLADGNELVGLIMRSPTKVDFGEPEWKAMAKNMAEEAGAPVTFHVIGTKNIDDLCNAFKLISETEDFVQKIFPYKHSFSKYELAFANNCVNICMQGGSVKKYYNDLIAALRSDDDQKTKQLFETLECFMLDSRMNAAKTATLLKVHSNTVQYRIKRIKEILRIDITGNTIAPGLMMALAVSRIEKDIQVF